MEDHLKSKGINVNVDSLRQRIKTRKSITQLEDNQDKKAKNFENESDDESMGQEKRVGRKRKRSISSDEEMKDDQKSEKIKGTGRSLTPA